MKRSLSFLYVLILWALPAAGQDGLLGTWETVEEESSGWAASKKTAPSTAKR